MSAQNPTLAESLAQAEAWFDRSWNRMVLAEGRERKRAEKDFHAAAVTLASLRQCANTEAMCATATLDRAESYELRKIKAHEEMTAAEREAFTVYGVCTCPICMGGI